jgi:hypothetical protein
LKRAVGYVPSAWNDAYPRGNLDRKSESACTKFSTGRLQRMAEALSVPVTFFFGWDATSEGERILSPLDYLSTEAAIRLARAFSKIENSKIRYAVAQIVEHIAGEAPMPMRKRSPKK